MFDLHASPLSLTMTLLAASLLLAFPACATESGEAAGEAAEAGHELPSQSDEASPANQDEYGIIWVEMLPESPDLIDFPAFSRVLALNNILSNTGLNTAMSIDQKIALGDHLFDNFPSGADAVYREVALPQYFQNDDPLIFQLRSLLPGEQAEVDAAGILIIQSNIFIDRQQGQIDPGSGRFSSLNENVSFIFMINDSNALSSARLLDSPVPDHEDIALDDDPRVLIAAVEQWLHSSDPVNLVHVIPVLDAIQQQDDVSPVLKAVTELNRFLYHLRTDDSEAAEQTLAGIRSDDHLAGDPEVLRVIETEAEAMLAYYRALRARGLE